MNYQGTEFILLNVFDDKKEYDKYKLLVDKFELYNILKESILKPLEFKTVLIYEMPVYKMNIKNVLKKAREA